MDPGNRRRFLIDVHRGKSEVKSGEAMMSSGRQKPPVAPKPKLALPQRTRPSPSTPRRAGLALASPGTEKRLKPALAPKPCLSKPPTAVDPIALASKIPLQTSGPQTPRIKGLLNAQNGMQQENKKPDWDYIIPICLCSQEHCMCIRQTSVNRILLSRGTVGTSGEKTNGVNCNGMKATTNGHLTNHKPLNESFTLDKRLNADGNDCRTEAAVRPPLPHRTPSEETNGHVIPRGAPGRGPRVDAFGSERVSSAPQSRPVPAAASRKPIPVPVPVPRKTPVAVRAHQEKVDEQSGEIVRQEGREFNVKEVTVSSEGKGLSSQTAFLPVRKASAQPSPLPRKKPLLSAPDKATAPAPRAVPGDVEEEDLGWDCSVQEIKASLGKYDEEVQKERVLDEDLVFSDFTQSPLSSGSPHQPERSQPPAVDSGVRVAVKKPLRNSAPMALLQRKESSEEEGERKLEDGERSRGLPTRGRVFQDMVTRELPSPPVGETSRKIVTPEVLKPTRSSLSKQKAKSFSGADLLRSHRPKKNSFRKMLHLTLSAKMLPKLKAKGDNSSDCSADEKEQNVDRDQDGCQNLREDPEARPKFPCALIGVEQNVDGDEYYENVPHYEDIPDYVNVHVGGAVASSRTSTARPPACEYDDDGIYEEHEPYMSFEKNTGLQRCETPADDDRSSVDEEVTPLDDGELDEDNLANTSEEEGDSSSTSSQGDPEQPEEGPTQIIQKKSKIHHIATEIMSSESVFVDVLKLLHEDFRDTVSAASRQSGKPVIEERLLNQILYNLPQLYELNQDLLRELKQRVAKWDENAQLADIFLKKGPYLKMYSTYIREFDKNVALLEEQSKKNPAFGTVVREFEASPRCANLALKHYLLKPVQRIPQYRLLLTDYLKNQSEDSVDYKDTEAALEIVKEVASHANDAMKQGHNFQKLIQVQCSLSGHHEIVQPGRIFLKEGTLKKLSRKVMQPRMFFLFNDTLLYTTPVQSSQYKLKNMLSLAGMKVSKPSQEAYQNELNIESVERSFILSASSASERDEWLEAISTAITDYTKKKISFISGKPPEEVERVDWGDGALLGSKAPIWIPDPRTTMCMICTCEFTLTWRRHHCRACGKVVCQSCSANKCCLEYLKNQLARVCDQCFPVLQLQSVQAQSTALSPGSRATFAFSRKQKKIPAALKEVTASTDNSSMSGYLQRSKSNKKQGKRLWFVIKDKVLYTYAASEDVAALESQPLLGFVLKVDSAHELQFKLYHKKTLHYIFKADDVQTQQRWIDSFKDATVL
ncbi:FYVE, RhoGEF and PH domain-containing protein 6-like [Pungitius pungitius]|uniref:FYVE, RhoGEF and PH domain-containing protein 6-like n=1 Tax=Pungitius pungitius TaxID=134920 RepID=UPI002E106936